MIYRLVFLMLISSIGIPLTGFAQAYLKGLVTDESGRPMAEVSVTESGANNGTTTDVQGRYRLTVPSEQRVNIRVSALGYEREFFNVRIADGDSLERPVVLYLMVNQLTEIEIKDEQIRHEAGTIELNTEKVQELPSTIGGIEGLLKILVGSNNELTSQYTVRGGNFDENLVYVNDFEIYRPFLVRSGQQEGLSFVNSDLVSGVNFSVGGFAARYGDKMSSVLDVTYKRPRSFGGSVMLSFLGAQGHLEGTSANQKFSYLIGARQKSNQYLLQSQPTKGQYNPSFTDIQTLLNYRISDKWEAEVIANYARNSFKFQPEEQVAAFGYVNKVYRLRTFFEGQESDRFDSYFGGLSLSYRPNSKLKLKLIGSAFQTNETETFDIYGEYGLYEVESDLGKTTLGQDKISLGTGLIHDYARNYLTANVARIAHKGSYSAGSHFFEWGLEGNFVQVDDQLLEWQRRDSAGFSVPFDTAVINMAEHFSAKNKLDYSRFSAFVQDNILLSRKVDMTLNIGLRINYSLLNDELILSPRLQYAFKPNWEKDVVFRIATGLYAQPPFYRELRDFDGKLHTDVKAQKSYHAAAGLDYNFKMWGDRPFKLTAEVYYKQLWDLIPYEYDDVRIRYFPDHTARGYAYGGEVRLFGDLVKNAESWVSVGFLKTEHQIFDEASGTYGPFIPRPTDQRLNFGIFFSDYLPRNDNFKMYLNLMYATGLPFSPPGKSLDPIYKQLRIPDYIRADIGFSALLLDGKRRQKRAHSLFNGFESIWISAEVFNLLGIENTLSYQWIQDFSSDRIFAVPNRLTNRLINLKLACRF